MTRPPPPHSQFPVPDPARQLVLDTCLASEWLWLSVPLHLKRLSLRRSSFPLALADRSSGPLPRPPPPVGTIYSTVTRMVMGSRAPILQTALRAAAPAFVQWGAQLKSPNLPSEMSRIPSVTWSLWGRVAHAREGKLQSARPPGAASVATSQTQLVTREALFREPRLSFSRSFFLFLPSFSTFELVGFTTVKSPNRQRLGDVQ